MFYKNVIWNYHNIAEQSQVFRKNWQHWLVTYLLLFFLSSVVSPGDVLLGSSGHKDTLEADYFPAGEAFFCPSRSVTPPRKKNALLCQLSYIVYKSLHVYKHTRFALYVFASFHDSIFLVWTSAVRHSELQQLICLWWRCSQAGWHLLSVTRWDSEGSKQITFSHLRQHVKLHLIASSRPLNHDMLQEEHFVNWPVKYLLNYWISRLKFY